MQRSRLAFLVLMVGLTLAACVPTTPPTPTPTPIPPTATQTPIPPTKTPTPTATPEPTQAMVLAPGVIAYTSISSSGVDIYAIKSDGSSNTRLTSGPGNSFAPRWSPDGKLIAFLRYDPQAERVDIWTIDLATGTENQITRGGVEPLSALSWSSDSRFLVFAQSGELGPSIYRLEIASGGIMNLTADYQKWNHYPMWSPASDQIAFVTDRAVGGGNVTDNIWLMAPNGSGLRNLTNCETWENTKPAWSPDGQEIAFYRWSLFGDPQRGPGGIWAVKADGSSERLVVAADLFLNPDPPVWSPDGQWITLTFGDLDEEDVWIVPAEGGKMIQLSDLPGQASMISWSPDSQALLFMNTHNDTMSLYVVAVDGSTVYPLGGPGENGLGDWSP